ncbi:hypothetical protein HPP92_000575 [Vanilla planifolia]|uniref:Uncharacterized protein n=1 Tax=Vanilla planifolia TaxID=51239 RepID=A0A835RUP9_VANPL|nr:hypothetical protein HPP92_000575 [Vanilla planifolia]
MERPGSSTSTYEDVVRASVRRKIRCFKLTAEALNFAYFTAAEKSVEEDVKRPDGTAAAEGWYSLEGKEGLLWHMGAAIKGDDAAKERFFGGETGSR